MVSRPDHGGFFSRPTSKEAANLKRAIVSGYNAKKIPNKCRQGVTKCAFCGCAYSLWATQTGAKIKCAFESFGKVCCSPPPPMASFGGKGVLVQSHWAVEMSILYSPLFSPWSLTLFCQQQTFDNDGNVPARRSRGAHPQWCL